MELYSIVYGYLVRTVGHTMGLSVCPLGTGEAAFETGDAAFEAGKATTTGACTWARRRASAASSASLHPATGTYAH